MASRKSRSSRGRRAPPGTPPGTLTPDPEASGTRLQGLVYGPDSLAPTDRLEVPPAGQVLWLNVEGLGDRAVLETVAARFGLHPLAMEDAVNQLQRPKAEAYDSHLFVVMRMPERGATGPATEQVAMFLLDRVVITVQADAGDVFDPVRARLAAPSAPMRRRGADYLAYALIDSVIDAFFPVIEALGERLERIEDSVVTQPRTEHIREIHAIKRELAEIRGAIWPLRDLLSTLMRDEAPRFSAATQPYLRDAQDHTFQLIDMILADHEIATSLTDLWHSSQAMRTGEVMRVLTLISTIFIPLTFVAGVYGMNFDVMPELRWAWGYPAVLALMATIAVALLLWFRRLGWLGRR